MEILEELFTNFTDFFFLQAFSKMGPLLSATIAKKKDSKNPGMCSIVLSVRVP